MDIKRKQVFAKKILHVKKLPLGRFKQIHIVTVQWEDS